MNKIIYNLVFNKKKLNLKGTALLQVEASLRNKKKYFSTNVYLRPDQWNSKNKTIINHPNADALNQMVYDYIAFIEGKELMIWRQGKTITLEALKEVINKQSNEDSFITFCHEETQRARLKDSTKKNHFSTIELLKQFRENLSLSDLNYDCICSFEHFLVQKGYHINTIAKHMKHIKRYINVAINQELILQEQYPFRKYKIKTGENHYSYLAPEELDALENLKFNSRWVKLKKILDAFLFCCYTGLRYSDFISLESSNFVMMGKDLWLIYKSVKTKIEVRVPLYLLFEGKCLNLLKQHWDNLPAFFSLKDNSNVNKDLIRIAKMAGLQKHISFHTARHTNATLLIYNGVNITSVQKILGHKNVKTTQVYSTVMDMTLVRELEKVFNGR
ncbi:site-specific integrase [Bacteroides sp. 519]|uniref:site-specific integrase n=1 Tax=Bacteroides sp. 519 TaxID=2302937 RepID=UPI0013D247D8|nr:site-specific integrase [Bacteroides sp. 519]NDV59317.1 site-specific integrase [Bacteroides sp. 519]